MVIVIVFELLSPNVEKFMKPLRSGESRLVIKSLLSILKTKVHVQDGKG